MIITLFLILKTGTQNWTPYWLDYINHHSPEWQEEYTAFCKEKDLIVNEESAEEFVDWKGEQIEAGE